MPNRGYQNLKGINNKLKTINPGKQNVNMHKIPNPSFNYRNRADDINASTDTPMEVYLRSVEGMPMTSMEDANNRRFKKPSTSNNQYRARPGIHQTPLQEYQMQTL